MRAKSEAVITEDHDGRISHHSFIPNERVTTANAHKLRARNVDAKLFLHLKQPSWSAQKESRGCEAV